jgi:NTP pyrophosphatase (non-canonical NTP hydrolase)
MNNMNELISQVRLWGEEKGIIGKDGKANPMFQFEELVEEVVEVQEGIKSQDQHAIIDGIGDCALQAALRAAYDEIKGRTGIMVDGQFVKDKQ